MKRNNGSDMDSLKRILLSCVSVLYCSAILPESISNIDEYMPKGEYHVQTQNESTLEYERVVYEVDAVAMDESWEKEGFWLNDNALTTGVYNDEESYMAKSPVISIPQRSEEAKIFLKLDSRIHSESYYDLAYVRVWDLSTDQSSIIYKRSGIKEQSIEYIDLVSFQGRDIQLELLFQSDSLYGGDGWSIFGVSIVEDSPQKIRIIRANQLVSLLGDSYVESDSEEKTELEDVPVLEYGGKTVHLFDVSHNADGSGTVSFALYEEGKGYYTTDNINASDFILKIDGKQRTICGEIKKSQKNNVDVVVALDCSGSMGTSNKNLITTIPNLIQSINDKFNARIAPLRFGASISSSHEVTENIEYGDFSTGFLDITPETNYGNWEMYYHILSEITKTPKNFSQGSQKIIIMIGDESSDNRYTDSLLNNMGPDKNIINQKDIANSLDSHGFQTYIINQNQENYKKGFSTIVDRTHGKYIDLKGGKFDSDSIINHISGSLNSRYFMDFCADTVYNCDTVISVSLELKDTHALDSTNTVVEYMPSIKRTSETIGYDTLVFDCKGTLPIAFTVSDYCSGYLVDSAFVYFRTDSVSSFDTAIAKKEEINGETVFIANLPINEKNISSTRIDYRIAAFLDKGRFVASSPLETETVGNTWTIPLCCDGGSCASLSRVNTISWDCDSMLRINVQNPTDLLKVYFSYNNGYREDLSASQYTYVPVRMTKDSNGDYSAPIPNEIIGKHIAYYIYMVDSSGVKMWYGNGNETMKDTIIELDCEQYFCSSLQLTTNPIRSDECVLSFELLKEREVTFAIFHANGQSVQRMNGDVMIKSERGYVGRNEYRMDDLFPDIFNMNINPKEPLILSVSTGKEISMVYFFVSRVNGGKK
ncbi:MAG: hypothetical protein MJZ11_12640 [Lachnospiraceae bacterium]|nr:hypothetical protein [Lachnospiraceae bacterium]